MAQHLYLPEPRPLASRRASGGGGGGPQRDRASHGRRLGQDLSGTVRAPRRLDAGIDPDLVFKVKATTRPPDSGFEGRGLEILGETTDFTYFVLSRDDGSALSQAIDHYARTGELKSFFDVVDGIEPYSSADRRGPGIDELFAGSVGWPVTLDIGLWASATNADANIRAEIVRQVVKASGGAVLMESITARRSFIRVRVTREGLDDLLETSVVEVVRTPPVPFLDFREWRELGAVDLERAETPGSGVGVLDDAPAISHPLLQGLVTSVDEIAPPEYPWRQQSSHGTEVTGRVLYPNLQEDLRELRPLTAVGTVRVARILEPDPQRGDGATRFASWTFPHKLVEQAIRELHSKYGVRVFNLSAGYSEAFDQTHVGPLTEVIDDLARELDIVIVVPTGNVPIGLDGRTPSGHHVIDDKPVYFRTPQHRVAEPGPAALAVTVGATALSAASAEIPGRLGWVAVSEVDELAPFSRTGPGLGTAARRVNKPDVVHYGGNVVLNDSGFSVPNDLGASIVTTSTRHDGRLFAAVNGTSFASPAVARIAASIADEYPDSSANLIRALLGAGAESVASLDSDQDWAEKHWLYGYGHPSVERSTASGPNRVTMTYDGRMRIDTVQIHPLPMPEVFRRGSHGHRTISVALAFDPPVRRQRREYIASTMKVDVYRDIDPEDLAEMLAKQDADDPNAMIKDRRRLKLEPGSTAFGHSTLQVRKWSVRNSFVDDLDPFYVVVTNKAQTWARDRVEYSDQKYALAVTLEDRLLAHADLHSLLTQQVRVPARVRLRT